MHIHVSHEDLVTDFFKRVKSYTMHCFDAVSSVRHLFVHSLFQNLSNDMSEGADAAAVL